MDGIQSGNFNAVHLPVVPFQFLFADKRVEKVILPLRDGLTIIRKC